jgi:hypothetical protein
MKMPPNAHISHWLGDFLRLKRSMWPLRAKESRAKRFKGSISERERRIKLA